MAYWFSDFSPPNTPPKSVGGSVLSAGSLDTGAVSSAFFTVVFLAAFFFLGAALLAAAFFIFIFFFLRAGLARLVRFAFFAFDFFRFFAMIILPIGFYKNANPMRTACAAVLSPRSRELRQSGERLGHRAT